MNTSEANQNEQTRDLSEFLKAAHKKAQELIKLVPEGSKEVGVIIIATESHGDEEKNQISSICAMNGNGEVLKNGLRSVIDNKEQPFKFLVLEALKDRLVERLCNNQEGTK